MRVRPAIILVEDQKVLLLKYTYNGQNVFSLPGGNPDPNETVEVALKRELMEELFLEVDIESLVIAGETIKEDKFLTVLHLVFKGSMKSGLPKINSEQTTAQEIVWINIEELHLNNLYPNVGKFIQGVFNNTLPEPYVGRIPQNWV